MGLDMYIRKATKPNLNARKVYIHKDLQKQEYDTFEAESDGSLPSYLKDLKPFMVKLRCIAEYFDCDKIGEAFGFSERPHWSGFGPDGIYFSSRSATDEYKSVTIPHETIREFTYTKKSIFYVTKLQNVGYWRKHYELDDALTQHFLKTRGVVVENCGYYRMTKAAMQIVEKYTKKHDTEPVDYQPEEIRSLFYHNWY